MSGKSYFWMGLIACVLFYFYYTSERVSYERLEKNSPTADSYYAFIKDFPDGNYKFKAYDSLLKIAKTEEQYKMLIRVLPEGSYKSKAYDGLLAIATNEGIVKLERFAKENPNISQGRTAKSRVDKHYDDLYFEALLLNTLAGWKTYKLKVPYERYRDADSRISSLERENWSTDNKAWQEANRLNTSGAFKYYLELYPHGVYKDRAYKKVIDLEVDEIFQGDYGQLPSMDSQSYYSYSSTSTIKLTNNTEYTLTVLYSGNSSEKVVLLPRHSSEITLSNGNYRIAASVNASKVQNYAGSEKLDSGRYEVEYYIKQRRF